LTPREISEKSQITSDFLKSKEVEFIKIQVEIEELRQEVELI